MSENQTPAQGTPGQGGVQTQNQKTKQEFEKWYENKPLILKYNTWFWNGFWGNADARHERSIRYAKEVEEWLLQWFPIHRIERLQNTVLLDGVTVFSIHSSRKNVYKKQNLPLIKKRAKEYLEE